METNGKIDELAYHYILRELMRELIEKGSSTRVRKFEWVSTVDGVSTTHTATVGLGSRANDDWLWVEHTIGQKAGTIAFQPVERKEV